MDALILLGAASGLPPLLPVGDGDQGVTGKPGDSLDIAVALAREAIDGVGSRHPGTRFLVDPGHPQARRRLRDDGKLPVAIGERGPAWRPVPRLPSHRAYRYSRPPR